MTMTTPDDLTAMWILEELWARRPTCRASRTFTRGVQPGIARVT
jgi:hypothetical protein